MMPGSLAELAKEAQMEDLRRDVLARGRKLCPYCGLSLTADGLCPHHAVGLSEYWARGNRIWCNFIHRKIVLLPADTPPMPDDDFTFDLSPYRQGA